MSTNTPIRVALYWHMHQPSYRNLLTGETTQPWTYLHALKDYADMAYHLEQVPGARATVNFVPVLLDEIERYAEEVTAHLSTGTRLLDPMLSWLANDRPLPQQEQPRRQLIADCLRAHEKQMIAVYPHYQALAELARPVVAGETNPRYLSDDFIIDLLVWHHLSWLGESIRQTSPVSDRLFQIGSGFTLEDRQTLLALIAETLQQLIPRYRTLHQNGRVELTLSPYAHPIIPLLLDTTAAHQSQPDAPLPHSTFPQGEKRANWHFRYALERFQHHFGFRPDGLWPSEGAICTSTLRLAEAHGIRWCATGEQVWRNTLDDNRISPPDCPPGAPLQLKGSQLYCFARSDAISDRIGFIYAPWHSDDAVNDLIDQILAVGHSHHWHPNHLLAIIMDGENAWEHYPQNGWHFLRTLYQRLLEHPGVELTHFSEALTQGTAEEAIEVERITAGSWVYGTLSTWIGNTEKNRAWELLNQAAYDLQPTLDHTNHPDLPLQMATCESSDWFWWLGEEPPSLSASEFDQLFRTHLQNLYRMGDRPPPAELQQPIDPRGGVEGGTGTMKQVVHE